MLGSSAPQLGATTALGGRQLCARPAHRQQRGVRRQPLPARALHAEGSAGGQQEYRVDPERLLARLHEQRRVGSEYGEGFVQFRLSGESVHLDVDTLNERLRTSGATRMRHAMKPDEAYGMVFNWDGVVCDTRGLQRRAWAALAAAEGLPLPRMERQLYDIPPERAVTEVLQWTREWGAARELAAAYGDALAAEFAALDAPLPGVRRWLRALHRAGVPCAIVTQLDRMDMRAALERMGLQRYFVAEVSAEDGMETLSQRFLSAAVKLQRPPNTCVVFDSCPAGVAAAHNCTMKAVAVRSLHAGHTLGAADLTVATMAELSVINVRRLFAMRGAEFMDLSKARDAGAAPRRRLTHALLERDDDKQHEALGGGALRR